ncbi:hypothetical protein F511_33062 [Dorcoceras hygrometricum]|uniref:Uncharacterized protein n=1 Tax=Dorcoceras hygrometricum TaxID=472368 RepID=A0A2Z7DBX9_9LAMI|nr:hypothetical protein F511_33062 [Dorcoceras hygrometricum]
MLAGRRLAALLCDSLGATSRNRCTTLALEARCWPRARDDGRHEVRRWALVARAAAVRFYGGGGGGRPPLRRSSGDVVTAGLISSRVWFGPVPGSP